MSCVFTRIPHHPPPISSSVMCCFAVVFSREIYERRIRHRIFKHVKVSFPPPASCESWILMIIHKLFIRHIRHHILVLSFFSSRERFDLAGCWYTSAAFSLPSNNVTSRKKKKLSDIFTLKSGKHQQNRRQIMCAASIIYEWTRATSGVHVE